MKKYPSEPSQDTLRLNNPPPLLVSIGRGLFPKKFFIEDIKHYTFVMGQDITVEILLVFTVSKDLEIYRVLLKPIICRWEFKVVIYKSCETRQ
jgi:hypothetical protein